MKYAVESEIQSDIYGTYEAFAGEQGQVSPPTVSIIMSVYNGEKFLANSIKSILAQSFPDFELWVANDGSQDDSLSVLKHFARIDARVRYVNQDNIGLTKSLNRMLRLISGKYIARLDADDLWFPEKLALQVSRMEQNAALGVLGTGAIYIDAAGMNTGVVKTITGERIVRRTLACYNPILHSSVIMRAKVVLVNGGYDDRYDCAQDYDLWLRMAHSWALDNLSQPLCARRITSGMISCTRLRRQRFLALRSKFAHRSWKFGGKCFWLYCLKDLLVVLLPEYFVARLKQLKQVRTAGSTSTS
ncbi:glycosyltransferase family 2 protein [Desulfobaculum sp. SPO524]|uniref:glycosyltransferase family 2 protein n=1 Tax=Desulfobaculum sp. SPO524 TaxID=3378071 RepID=UPI0038526C03